MRRRKPADRAFTIRSMHIPLGVTHGETAMFKTREMAGLLIFCNDCDYFIAHRYDQFSQLEDVEVNAYCGGELQLREKRAFSITRFSCDRYSFRPLRDFLLLVQMLVLLKRHAPEVVHTITIKPNLLGGLAVRIYNLFAARKCRLVMMTAGLGRIFAGGKGWMRRLVVLGLKAALSGGDIVAVFENTADRDHWVSLGILKRSSTRLLPGAGVDPHKFRFAPGRAASPLRILFASRLLKSKGLELFIDIATEMACRGIVAEFIIAGRHDPKDPDSVDLSEHHLPANVSYIGPCTDMPSLLSSTHVVLLPTVYSEGLPRILIEAAATGNVLIASDIPGCRRIVDHGKNGFLLPVRGGKVDFEGIVGAIEALVANPDLVKRMGAAGNAKFYEGGFDIASVRTAMKAILFNKPANQWEM
ncbi:MAG TPA: glycosyltransferase [Rhizobiaceae bacterium]|nr:glycosyltransferase [Rhizobiaceae bacterium]